jgi:hypothetical protein
VDISCKVLYTSTAFVFRAGVHCPWFESVTPFMRCADWQVDCSGPFKAIPHAPLVYITRIAPPSAELARILESSGFHIKSFGPGEITADECLLVMTSEAVLAGLRLTAITGTEARLSDPSQGAPSLQDLQKHLGVESEIWNRIKAAGVIESAAETSRVASRQSAPAPPAVVPEIDNLGFVASQAGMRVLAASQQKATAAGSQSLPAAGIKDTSDVPQIAAQSMAKVIREAGWIPTLPLRKARSAAVPRTPRSQQRFWQPAVLAAALLICAVVLLAGRASVLRPAADKSGPGAQSGSKAAGQARRGSARTQLAQPLNHNDATAQSPNLATEGRHRISDYDFVAEDYTTHFDVHGRTVQSPDLQHGAQSRMIPRRIVVN